MARRWHLVQNFTSPIRIVLLTDVALHRHVLAAFNLFLKVPMKAFPGGELKIALDCLGATIAASEVRLHFARMAHLLGVESKIFEGARAMSPR